MRVECDFGGKKPIKIKLEVDKENIADCTGCEIFKNGGTAMVINRAVIWCDEKKVEKQEVKLDLFKAGHERSYFASEPE
jgi:hypothetical protein